MTDTVQGGPGPSYPVEDLVTPDQKTITGEGTAQDPLRVIFGGTDIPTKTYAFVVNEIFATATGSDASGTGTQASPYRTFARAMRDVPNVIPPGTQYIVDVTNIDLDVSPTNYALPAIQTPNYFYPNAGVAYSGNPARPWFLLSPPLLIRADPRLDSSLSPADAVITAAQATSLTAVAVNPASSSKHIILTIDTPRPSWAGDALKGKHVRRTVGAFIDFTEGGVVSTASCVIESSSPTQLFLTIGAGAFNNGAGALVMAPGEEIQIVELSATLSAPQSNPVPGPTLPFPAQVNDIFFSSAGAITCDGIPCVGFQGIKFQCVDPQTVPSLFMRGNAVSLEMCEVDSFQLNAAEIALFIGGCVFTREFEVFEGFTPAVQCSLFLNCNGSQNFGFFFTSTADIAYNYVTFDACDPIGSGGLTEDNAARQSFVNTQFRNGTGFGAGFPQLVCSNPAGYNLNNVQIDNSAGDAIAVAGGARVIMNNVNGSGNAGFGLHCLNGTGSVQVLDDATLITGMLGDLKVDPLPPRGNSAVAGVGWNDFRTLQPIKNEYALATPFVVNVATGLALPGGEETTGAGTGGYGGARVFQLPAAPF